jgi:transglutaminase-like putative cysteine protease
MQTDVGSPIETVAASFIYAVRYSYSDTVIHNDNQLRIFPREGEGQSVAETELWSIPSGRGVDYKDRFGNRVRRLRVIEPHSTFIVAVGGRVSLSTQPPVEDDLLISDLRELPESYEYTAVSPLVDPESSAELAFDVAGRDRHLLVAVNSVVRWVYQNIVYRRGATSVATTADQVLVAGEGVCQDKTHLALGMLRALKVPCRYASGLITGQTGETHSWVEFFHPIHGWLGADPTRGSILPPACDYVKLGVGRDYTDVSPVTGSFLSKGEAEDIAAIADVSIDDSQPTLGDALELLDRAYIVQNETGSPVSPMERPERDR